MSEGHSSESQGLRAVVSSLVREGQKAKTGRCAVRGDMRVIHAIHGPETETGCSTQR